MKISAASHVSEHASYHALGFAINLARQSVDPDMLASIASSDLGDHVREFLRGIFTGMEVNPSEKRAALHWVYRLINSPEEFSDLNIQVSAQVHGRDELALAQSEVARMEAFVNQVRNGQYTNPKGERYDSILHLGIGGSDLGPRLLDQVFNRLYLREGQPPFELRFVANLDFHEQEWSLRGLNPEKTLVIVASKSFGTRETLVNAQHIIEWLQQAGPTFVQAALVAATCKPQKAMDLGVEASRVFSFSEDVGGRYSLWGPVSIAIRMVYGNAVFQEFLQGAAQMDAHALNSPLTENLPVLLAMSDHANLNRGVDSLMMSPYDSRMSLLIPYLQQLWMESLGKGINLEGELLSQTPCPMLWGDVGTNGQHAFFQILHQSPVRCAVELIAFAQPNHTHQDIHQLLMTHFLAQAEAFAVGRLNSTEDRHNTAVNFRTCLGQRPVTSMIIDKLTPKTLGTLLCMWEHRTTALSALRGVNPFDQWGVELGKTIAQGLEPALDDMFVALAQSEGDKASVNLDTVTQELIHNLQSAVRRKKDD
jgi:glucose-6-phosphate isomerase